MLVEIGNLQFAEGAELCSEMMQLGANIPANTLARDNRQKCAAVLLGKAATLTSRCVR